MEPPHDADSAAWLGFLESYSGGGLRRFSARGMGTENVILLPAEETGAGALAQEAFQRLDQLEELLSKFIDDSELSLVNAFAAQRPMVVGDDLFLLLERATEAWEATGGAFDPTIGSLMRAWGLVDMEGRVPDSEALAAARRAGGMGAVELDREAQTVRFARLGIELDLGGIAKGHAADCMVAHLKAQVPYGAVVCGRSTVLTWGLPPGDTEWNFEVVNPLEPSKALCSLAARPGAVSSSGAYERRFRKGVKYYGHILDPRSGRPAESLLGATVWTESALLGDIVSTALFVVGSELLAPGAGLERLAEHWQPSGREDEALPFSALLVAEDPSAWGGISQTVSHLGSGGFRVLEE